jgi:hypothetical protein
MESEQSSPSPQPPKTCTGCRYDTRTGFMLCSHPDSRPDNPQFWENVEDYRCHTPKEGK